MLPLIELHAAVILLIKPLTLDQSDLTSYISFINLWSANVKLKLIKKDRLAGIIFALQVGQFL
jgi:hypothetical protein